MNGPSSPHVVLVDCHFRPSTSTNHYYVTEHTEPLGLEYLAGFLKNHGISCVIIRWPASELPIYSQEEGPAVVGVSGLTYAYPEMKRAAAAAKRQYPGAVVVAGREHASAVPEEVLAAGHFDAVVIGEGELPLLRLAQGHPLSEVPSLVWRGRNGFVHNNRAKPLPVGAWASPVRQRQWMKNMFTESSSRHQEQAGIMLSRGCVFRCEFCTAEMMWGQYRHGEVDHALNEVRKIRTGYGIRYFAFHDLMINGRPPVLHEFLNRIEEEDMDVEFFAMASVTKAHLDFDLMKRAGMHELGIGIEVPTDRRQGIGKILGIDEAEKFVRAAQEAGIFIRCYLIIGWPWDRDVETIVDRHVRFLRRLGVNAVRIHFLTPFPGTQDWLQHREHFLWEDIERHYQHFTTMEPVLHFDLEPEELIVARARILKEYYSSAEYDRLRLRQANDPVLDEMNVTVASHVAETVGLCLTKGCEVKV